VLAAATTDALLENSERGEHFCRFNPYPGDPFPKEDVRVRVAPPVAKFVVPCRGGFWHAIVGYLTKLPALLQIGRGRRVCSIAVAIGLSSKRPLGLSKLHDRIVLLKTYATCLGHSNKEGVLITRPDRVCGGSAVTPLPDAGGIGMGRGHTGAPGQEGSFYRGSPS
jgi:hypothetical protein